MLRSAIFFFATGLLAFFLGVLGIAGVTPVIAKTILIIFLIFSLICFIGAITISGSHDRMDV